MSRIYKRFQKPKRNEEDEEFPSPHYNLATPTSPPSGTLAALKKKRRTQLTTSTPLSGHDFSEETPPPDLSWDDILEESSDTEVTFKPLPPRAEGEASVTRTSDINEDSTMETETLESTAESLPSMDILQYLQQMNKQADERAAKAEERAANMEQQLNQQATKADERAAKADERADKSEQQAAELHKKMDKQATEIVAIQQYMDEQAAKRDQQHNDIRDYTDQRLSELSLKIDQQRDFCRKQTRNYGKNL